jgi:hypothetical protein
MAQFRARIGFVVTRSGFLPPDAHVGPIPTDPRLPGSGIQTLIAPARDAVEKPSNAQTS